MIYFVENKDLIIVDRLQREVNHQTVEMWFIYIYRSLIKLLYKGWSSSVYKSSFHKKS